MIVPRNVRAPDLSEDTSVMRGGRKKTQERESSSYTRDYWRRNLLTTFHGLMNGAQKEINISFPFIITFWNEWNLLNENHIHC